MRGLGMDNQDDRLPSAYKYAHRVLELLESGELRLGYDQAGNALLFFTPEGDASRAVPLAILLPVDPVSMLGEALTE